MKQITQEDLIKFIEAKREQTYPNKALGIEGIYAKENICLEILDFLNNVEIIPDGYSKNLSATYYGQKVKIYGKDKIKGEDCLIIVEGIIIGDDGESIDVKEKGNLFASIKKDNITFIEVLKDNSKPMKALDITAEPYVEKTISRNDRFREFENGDFYVSLDALEVKNITMYIDKGRETIEICVDGFCVKKATKVKDIGRNECLAYYKDLIAWRNYWKEV